MKSVRLDPTSSKIKISDIRYKITWFLIVSRIRGSPFYTGTFTMTHFPLRIFCEGKHVSEHEYKRVVLRPHRESKSSLSLSYADSISHWKDDLASFPTRKTWRQKYVIIFSFYTESFFPSKNNLSWKTRPSRIGFTVKLIGQAVLCALGKCYRYWTAWSHIQPAYTSRWQLGRIFLMQSNRSIAHT